MRIVSGKYRGRKIQPPATLRARPTTDFAKEALFNILNNEIDLSETRVLDLFCGSGSISFEFLSRGATGVWSVDVDRKAVDFVRKFADKIQDPNIKTVKADVYQFLKTCTEQFDVVFADPPYGHSHVSKLPERVFNSDVLKFSGILIVEHGPEQNFENSAFFQFHRTYGNVNFSFFSKTE